jgi:hypothetical protein
MNRLKTFIREMAAVKTSNLDAAFLKRAQKVTSFNLRAADFESTQYKAEIQHLFRTHLFPDFDLSQTMTGPPNVAQLNKRIDILKRQNFGNYNKLHFYNLKGVGPGEATLYFLLDDAHLGGGGSAGVDLVIGSKQYEVKASLYSAADNTVYGFKLGGTAALGKMVNELVRLKNELGLKSAGKGQNEVGPKNLEAIQKAYPNEYRKLENDYARTAGQYFGKTPVIFINNNASVKLDPDDPVEKVRLLSNAAGNVLAIKSVNTKDIKIQTVTQGTIKPRVKI